MDLDWLADADAHASDALLALFKTDARFAGGDRNSTTA
jgi:hypothetical protein